MWDLVSLSLVPVGSVATMRRGRVMLPAVVAGSVMSIRLWKPRRGTS